jgi:pimeloyl-ACP methyl ester carboxylesterase
VKLATIGWGDGRRRALLIHGIQSNAAGWWRAGPALADMGFAVTAPDLRGHGSSPDPTDHTFDSHAADLIELGSRWDLVVGHSLGGALALVALRLDPGFAARLVLEDPALAIFDPDEALHQLGQQFGVEGTIDWVAEHNPTWHPEDVRIKVEALKETSHQVTEAILRQNEPWNVMADLAALTIPTLVLGADPELGALVPPALGESLGGLNEHIRFVSIPGSSHSMHRDEFEAFIGEIEQFLAVE